jgi:hypothetical protein
MISAADTKTIAAVSVRNRLNDRETGIALCRSNISFSCLEKSPTKQRTTECNNIPMKNSHFKTSTQ